nr:siderophore-interacting protein [Acinetobacter sp. Marseille-Q1620]
MSKQAYRVINLQLVMMQSLSPTMRRFSFESSEMSAIQTFAPDQRVKLFFPQLKNPQETQWIVEKEDWYQAYRQMPEAIRPPMRTYTIRNLYPEKNRVDIDFAMHGATGPASTWAESATIGDRIQMAAPNVDWDGEKRGFEWHPPAIAEQILLMADETALPAVAGIIEELHLDNVQADVHVLIEMPKHEDRIELPEHQNIHVHWLARENQSQPGEKLYEYVQKLYPSQQQKKSAVELENINVDEEILWFTGEKLEQQKFYAWIAAESKAVLNIRRYLAQECGIQKEHLNCMGYWRWGKVLG